MGRKSKKEEIHVYVGLIHSAVQQKLTQQCKATILRKKTRGLPFKEGTVKADEGTRGQPGKGDHIPSEVQTNYHSESIDKGTEQNILTKSIIAKILLLYYNL